MADCIVAERNFGGAMVEQVIRVASREGREETSQRAVPYREVTASRGKVVRAEPIAALFEQQKVCLAGYFPLLEDQLVAITTGGYVGDRSPDRADAMVWGLSALFPGMTKRVESELGARPRVNLGYQKMKQGRR